MADPERPEDSVLQKPDLFLVARFLEKLSAPDWEVPISITRSKLQRAVRLNYDVFTKYLDFLSARRLIEVVPASGSPVIRITKEGRRTYTELIEWLERLVDPGSS